MALRNLSPADRPRSIHQTLWTVAATLAFGSLLLVFSGDGGASQQAPEAPAPSWPSREACPIAQTPPEPPCPESRPDEAPVTPPPIPS